MNDETKTILSQIWTLVDYWDRTVAQPGDGVSATRDRLEGLAFSILSMLDGCGGLPGPVQLVPEWDDPDALENEMLHEHFYPVGRMMGLVPELKEG